MKITGTVRELDPASQTFSIGGMLVHYSGTSFSPPVDLINGALLDVAGHLIGNTVFAREIVTGGVPTGSAATRVGRSVRLEGLIMQTAVGPMINGARIRLPDDTDYRDGLVGSDPEPGLPVIVHGTWSAEGDVVVAEISALKSDGSVSGPVAQIDSTLQELLINDVRVQITARTVMIGAEPDILPFSALWVGDVLGVIGVRREDPRGTYLDAIRIARGVGMKKRGNRSGCPSAA